MLDNSILIPPGLLFRTPQTHAVTQIVCVESKLDRYYVYPHETHNFHWSAKFEATKLYNPCAIELGVGPFADDCLRWTTSSCPIASVQ